MMPDAYPLPYTSGDVRFSDALVCDVAEVLARHGYTHPLVAGDGLVHQRNRMWLDMCLWQMLYRCDAPASRARRARRAHAHNVGAREVPAGEARTVAQYPLRPREPLAVDVAAVARVLAELGWPAIRHVEDYARLAGALRRFAVGTPS